jgi:hypothetical protein
VNDSLHAEALTRWLRDEDAAVEVLRSCNIAELKDLKANHPNVLVRGLASKVVSEREPKPPPVIRNEGKKPVVIIPPKPESKITPKPDDRRTETVSIEHAIAKFKANYPKGFSDPLYGQLERDYKVKAHEKWMETLNEEEFKKLLTARDYAEIVNRALRVEATIKRTMLHRTQKMALHDAVQQPGDAKLFAKGLYDLIYGGDNDKARFEYFATVLGRLPHDKSAVLCWPVQTIFLFVALPKKHIFVKPNVTKDAAEWSGVSLNYKPRPNWTTYSCVLTLANKLKTALADLEPRDLDMIDIQSFIWATQYEAS